MRVKRPAFLLLFFIPLIAVGTAQETSQTMATIDKATKLNDVEWGRNSTLYIESNIPKSITITDINSIEKSGSGKVNFKRVRLSPGVNNISMQLEPEGDDYSVTIADRNDMIYASNPGKPYIVSVTTSDLFLAPWIFGIQMIVIALAIMYWREYKWGKKLRRII